MEIRSLMMIAGALLAGTAQAAPVPMDEAALADVHAQGWTLEVHSPLDVIQAIPLLGPRLPLPDLALLNDAPTLVDLLVENREGPVASLAEAARERPLLVRSADAMRGVVASTANGTIQGIDQLVPIDIPLVRVQLSYTRNYY